MGIQIFVADVGGVVLDLILPNKLSIASDRSTVQCQEVVVVLEHTGSASMASSLVEGASSKC